MLYHLLAQKLEKTKLETTQRSVTLDLCVLWSDFSRVCKGLGPDEGPGVDFTRRRTRTERRKHEHHGVQPVGPVRVPFERERGPRAGEPEGVLRGRVGHPGRAHRAGPQRPAADGRQEDAQGLRHQGRRHARAAAQRTKRSSGCSPSNRFLIRTLKLILVLMVELIFRGAGGKSCRRWTAHVRLQQHPSSSWRFVIEIGPSRGLHRQSDRPQGDAAGRP